MNLGASGWKAFTRKCVVFQSSTVGQFFLLYQNDLPDDVVVCSLCLWYYPLH